MPTESMIAAKPLDSLKGVCRLMLEASTSQEIIDFYSLCIAHVAKFPAISTITIRWNDRLAADLHVMIERAQRSGAFPSLDPAMVATGLIGVFISNPANRAALKDPQFRDSAQIQQYFDGLWMTGDN
jgi:hypothetical protein